RIGLAGLILLAFLAAATGAITLLIAMICWIGAGIWVYGKFGRLVVREKKPWYHRWRQTRQRRAEPHAVDAEPQKTRR
ncbi:MAG: hypothetical protein AAGJ83_05185, partial [Planctomycetota bacterium]